MGIKNRGRLSPSPFPYNFIYLQVIEKNLFLVIFRHFNGGGESFCYGKTVSEILVVSVACFGCYVVPCINGFFSVINSFRNFLFQIIQNGGNHAPVKISVIGCIQEKLVAFGGGVVNHASASFHGEIFLSGCVVLLCFWVQYKGLKVTCQVVN